MPDSVRIRLTPEAIRHVEDVCLRPVQDGLFWVVNRQDEPLPHPRHCPYCTRLARVPVEHENKTYHLKLDADYTTQVSAARWERMKYLHDNGGFELANVVRDPEPIHLTIETGSLVLAGAEL